MQRVLTDITRGTILETIGNTPLIRLNRMTEHLSEGISVYGKLEGVNPGGSVKDRPALQMIYEGLESGELRPGKTILDSTSGNTGIALAMIGSVLGYPVELCIPSNVSSERKQRILAYGARPVYTSPMEGSDGAIVKAREMFEKEPDKYFKPDQYSNEANPRAHYLTTGPELWRQTEGRITHFIATIGTSGTVMGTGRYLKEKNPGIQVIAAEPDDAFHGLEGLKHMESSIVPGIFHREEVDDTIPIPTEESYEKTRELARKEGIFAGQSSGGALWAALHLAEKLSSEGVREAHIVTVLCDSGDKYYSKNLWDLD